MGHVANGWGLCPECDAPLTNPVCSACDWSIDAILDEYLEGIHQISRDEFPSIKEPQLAAQQLADRAMGASMVLVVLGAMSHDGWMTWSKRLMDAAGIPWEPVSGGVSFEFTVTAEHDEDES